MPLRLPLWFFAASLLPIHNAHAEAGQLFGFIGGWSYDIQGTYTNTAELDLEDDLALRGTARKSYALGYQPAAEGWVPQLELDYVRIAASGQQRFTPFGLPLLPETVVDNRTTVNDFELTARWPWQLGSVTLLGGFTVTHLDGSVQAADEATGIQQTQKVKETFPLLSLGVQWQPVASLRFTLTGDYVRYDGNRADEWEAKVLWKLLGPVGLEGGYRQRRYKIDEPMNALDARVRGARFGVVMELPI